MDRSSVYRKTIEKGIINGASYDSLVGLVADMNSDMDKANLYKELIGIGNISETQWIDLISKISRMNSDIDKANLLVEIASKMPKTDVVKTNYQKAAKTLNNDMDYGRVMRAME